MIIHSQKVCRGSVAFESAPGTWTIRYIVDNCININSDFVIIYSYSFFRKVLTKTIF